MKTLNFEPLQVSKMEPQMPIRGLDEALVEYQARMGAELGKAYYALFCDIADLFEKWGDYETLYGTDPETIDKLNAVAPAFFGRLERLLRQEIIQHLARLTDPSHTGRHSNLSIFGLVENVSDPQLASELAELLIDVRTQTLFVVSWRNVVLAHKDRAFAIGDPNAREPQPVSRRQKKLAIDAIAAVMRAMSRHYCDAEIGFEETYGGDALDLLHAIER